jgi:hypothetical protein
LQFGNYRQRVAPFNRVIDKLRRGDVLVVAKHHRLARNAIAERDLLREGVRPSTYDTLTTDASH